MEGEREWMGEKVVCVWVGSPGGNLGGRDWLKGVG